MGYQGQSTCKSRLPSRQASGAAKKRPFDRRKQFYGVKSDASKQSDAGCCGAKEADQAIGKCEYPLGLLLAGAGIVINDRGVTNVLPLFCSASDAFGKFCCISKSQVKALSGHGMDFMGCIAYQHSAARRWGHDRGPAKGINRAFADLLKEPRALSEIPLQQCQEFRNRKLCVELCLVCRQGPREGEAGFAIRK